MQQMFLEVRDRGTRIPVLAIRMEPSGANPDEEAVNKQFLDYCGYTGGIPTAVLLCKIYEGESKNDPYGWSDSRTMREAHKHIMDHWDKLIPGQVVDVRVILKEQNTPASPEIMK
jgi:hypothetical protein